MRELRMRVNREYNFPEQVKVFVIDESFLLEYKTRLRCRIIRPLIMLVNLNVREKYGDMLQFTHFRFPLIWTRFDFN